jgi:hypothetical protein
MRDEGLSKNYGVAGKVPGLGGVHILVLKNGIYLLENYESLLLLAVNEQPSRRFGNAVDHRNLRTRYNKYIGTGHANIFGK